LLSFLTPAPKGSSILVELDHLVQPVSFSLKPRNALAKERAKPRLKRLYAAPLKDNAYAVFDGARLFGHP
jgi:hypothetical protein